VVIYLFGDAKNAGISLENIDALTVALKDRR